MEEATFVIECAHITEIRQQMVERQRTDRSVPDLVRDCITRFDLRLPGPVAVGLSGGKDSTTLAFVLRLLGFNVIPIIVDMGYVAFEPEQVAASARQAGFRPRVVKACDQETTDCLPESSRRTVAGNLRSLADEKLQTPCGLCSQTKRILLFNEASRAGASVLCLGHHREDLIVTLLKDYFVIRYYQRVGRYDRLRFAQFLSDEPIERERLRDLIQRHSAATMSVKLLAHPSIALLRPLALTPEAAIRQWVIEHGISTFGSGCSHSAFTSPASNRATKRELVHHEWRKRLAETPALGSELLALALSSLDTRGRALANPRQFREQVLQGFEEAE